MKDLKEKIIWITGATSGIGEALTYELAKKGVKLILKRFFPTLFSRMIRKVPVR